MCFNILTIDDQEIGSSTADALEIHLNDQVIDEAVSLQIFLFVSRSGS